MTELTQLTHDELIEKVARLEEKQVRSWPSAIVGVAWAAAVAVVVTIINVF